jgi:predicted Zn-dependent protease
VEAEAAFERALEQGELDLRTRILHAQVEIQLGKLERACALLEELRREFPDSAVPLGHLAEAQARRGDTEAARATLAAAERLDPGFSYLTKVRELLGDAPR